MPIYRYNNKVYDIPEDKIEDFENTYPNAYIELYANNKAYNIPSKLRKSFQQKYADWAYLSPAERNLSAPFDADADTGPYPPNIQGDESTNKHAANLAQYTFKTPEQRSATQVIADNAETLAGINAPAGLTKSPDPIQQAVSQDLINKAASQEWQRENLKHYQSEKERLQALYNQEIAKTSGRQFSSSFMDYNPSADTAMSRDASLYSLALQYLGDAEKQIIKAQKKSKATTPQQRNADDNYDLSQWQQSPSQYGYAPISIPGVKAPNKEQSQSPAPIQEAVAGVGDALFDIDTLTLGLDSLFKNATLQAILDKADADQPLTQAEESLLNAALYKQFTEAAYPDSRWYNVGKGIGSNIPYMLQFALSGGVAGALTKGAGKTIGKAITKYINNLALKNGGKIANRTARKVFYNTARTLGNGISNLSAGTLKALAQTPLQTSLYNDIIERQIGTLGYSPSAYSSSASRSEDRGGGRRPEGLNQDNNRANSRGGLQYTGRIDAESTGDAIRNGLASALITNITEGVYGEGLQFIFNKIGGGALSGLGKGYTKLTGKQIQSPRLYNLFREAVSKRGLKPLLDAVGFNGAPSEFAEEVLDQTLNAIFVGDSSLDPNSENYVFDLDNLIDTAITTGVISLFMGGMGAALSAKVHHDVNKAFAQANRNLETLKYSNIEIQALNDIAIDNPQNTAKWVSSITRTMRTLATSRADIVNSLSPEARQYLHKDNPTEDDKKALSLYDMQALTALGEITNRFNELTIQRDYVVAGTNYNAMIQGLKERVAPQAEAELADIQANVLRDSDYTINVKFKGQDAYLVSGTAEINDMPDGSTVATLPEGNIYQVRTKSPDGQWIIQQAIAEDIQPISVTPTQQLIDGATARIYTPVQNLINAEQAQAQAEVAQSQPPVSTPNGPVEQTEQAQPSVETTPAGLNAPEAPNGPVEQTSPTLEQATPSAEQREANTPPLPEGMIGEVSRSDGGVTETTPSGLNAPEAPNGSTQSTEEQSLSDEQFDEHIDTLPTGDAIQAITQRRGAEEADQYAQWRKGILTKERDKAHKTLNAKHKPFDPSRYTDYAQMKREERKHNDAIQATRNEALNIIQQTTAEIADIDRYLADRNRQIAAEREAENPLRNGIAPAVAKLSINTLEQYIARYIALGGRLRMSDQYSNGLAAELGITPGSQEHRELLSILSNTEGMTPEQLAHDISENIEPEYRHLIAGRDVQDIRNAIIDTIASGVTSRRRAYQYIADANEKLSADEQRYIEEQELQAQIDADTEQAIRDYEELLLSSLSPQDLAIIDAMAGDYWDEILTIDQEAYNSLISPSAELGEDRGRGAADGIVSNSQNIQTYDTNSTSTTPRITQQGAESTAIQSSTQPSNTTPIRQDSQDNATIRPETPQTSRNSSTPTNNEREGEINKQASQAPAAPTTDSYTITPTQYTTKRRNVLNMHLVKFAGTLTQEQQRAAKELAKADKGWYDREQGGFMMRSQESAQQLADTIASQPISMTDIKALNDGDIAFTEPQQSENKPHAPIWQYSIHVDTDGYTVLTREDVSSGTAVGDAYFSPAADSPEEMLEILRNPHNNMQEVLDAVGVILENKIQTRELDRKIAEQRKQEYEALRANGVNGYIIGEKVIYKGKEATIHDFEQFGAHQPVLDTGMAPVIYEVAEWSDIEHLDKDKSPAGLNAPVATDTQEQPTNQGQFGLVSDDRMAELKERLRRKLGGQMNIGIDPEILSIGLEIAVGHLDRGIKSFTDFARVMIADLGDTIRPYLKAFYNGARDLPEVIDNGLATDMTPYDEVQQFDITNFDRTVPDLTAAAANTAREAEVANEVNVAKQRIKRSTERKKSVTSSSNQLNLFDNTDNNNDDAREQDTRTNNRRTQPRREELPETESVEPRTPLQHTVEIGRSKRGNTRTSGNQSGNRPLYDVNKNYSNEEISQIVSSVTDIVDGRVVITAPITDDIRTICHQYKSGGVAKKGHGILDEYYTDGKIVDAVSMLITPYFNNSNAIRVLEPSVGVGNFISAVDNIPTSEIVTFEINPTTARIAKILYPGIDVNLRSFETEFIDDAGNKKPLPQKYNLIIGNPPYGSHRGLYKGLGEESKIARYEDYFVKRSLDVLNEGGVLAMVLPSSWIDRHTQYGGYTIEAAYRLPSGAFEATQVGTDIVILRKDSSIPTADHTPYFEQYPERVLGEVKQRKGRYGKMEDYVQGDIDTAIEAIKRDHAEQLANRLDITPSNDNLNNIEEAIDETGSLDKATAIVQTAKTEANSPAPSTTTGKKGKYKTVLNRGVETVPTSLQFSHQFSEGEVDAFYDTEYDGTINHPSQHRKYANYIGGRAMHDFYYAEGDIYTKLDQLESEKENIIATYGHEQYDKQKQLLMSVLPKRKGLSEITISPNTTFVKNLYIDTDKGSITLRDAFVDFCSKLPYQAFGDSSSWEVRGYVNNEQVYGQDKERNALVRERRKRVANDLFVKFLKEELSQSAQNQVVAAFNREYNSTYRPDYSRVPMFSTINKDFRGKPLKLTSVQLAGIGRMTVKGVGVLAHEVGFGKTLSGILAMHEAMTRGFATKPLVVVPNDNILKQWVETIKEVLPQATVNTLGNLGTSYDLTDFKVNDGEFTLVTYEGLKAMSFSDETYNRLAERFSYITEDLKKHKSERDQQKEIEKKQELKGRMKRGAKTSYGFEDFGFDWLTVDEVHNCNHIVSKVRLDKSVSSDFRSQNQRTSDLGLKTWLAAQYIQEENNGRNVLLLSATPFTNKPLEYYSILSLVGNKMLERKGFFHVDQFFSTFMEADNELEIGANGRPTQKTNGRPTQKTNVRRFRNNGLFQQLLSEFIDIKGEEDNPELVRPDRHNKEYKINPNELTEDAMAAVQDLLNDNDTVLQGIGHARAAAFSPYATSLLGIRPKNHREFVKNSPKINTTIKLIEQNKKDRPDAGQIIYSEVGVEYFPLIRDYLVNESGFKPSEVRIITGATSNAERVNIQTAFNNGEVKVVIGSPAIKEGLNLQENTTDMYILSLPWNFTQLRQIEGRGWRQGNKWENIRINYMLTNNSVDVFMLQRLQLKQGLYNEAMKKGAETLDVSDIDTSELKTALITDPAVRAEIVTKQEREKLQQQRTQIEADLSFVLRKYESYNKLIEKLESKKKEIDLYRSFIKNGNSPAYWEDRIQREETQLQNIERDIEQEKENLLHKGVNVDDIVLQTEQSQKAIEDINQKIDVLKEYQEELTAKYRREQELKQQQQGDLLATYIKERKAENNNGSFYKIRPKDSQIRFRSIRPDESLSDYARAVVANSPDIRFRFIGEQGAANLDRAEEATARLDNLAVARGMEQAGKDERTIKLATGWERGADNLWRYEVPDVFNIQYPGAYTKFHRYIELQNKFYENSSQLASDEMEELDKLSTLFHGGEIASTTVHLRQLIDDYDLFDAYPLLINTMVNITNTNGEAYYSPISNSISIDSRFNKDDFKHTLAHEIQHVIQNIEGFAKGGNLQSYKKIKTKIPYFGSAIDIVANMKNPSIDNLKKILNEENLYLYEAKEIREMINDIENGEYTIQDIINSRETPEAIYHKLAGEVEARNVQRRLNLTPEERAKSLAAETEDVAREDQIFIGNALGTSAMGSRVEQRMKEIASHYQGRTLSPTEQAIVDVFSGTADNLPITVKTADGNTRRIIMRQGKEQNAGTKHSIFRHYNTDSGVINVDDILLIPDVIANGTRTVKNNGKIEYKYSHNNGTKYTVLTEKNNRGAEVFTDFYTNKSGSARSSNTQLSAQADSITALSADKDNINSANNKTSFRSINPDESLSDYARAVVANSQQTPPSAGLNAPVGSRSQEDLELIEAATVRFKEYFNTPEIIQVFSRAELRKLYSDMTDAEFNERFKEYEKIGAIYDADRDKIYTFVENSENTYVELIHEATHAAIQKLYNSENLKDKLSHFVNEIEKAYTNFCKGLATTYSGDDYINELTAYTIDNFLNGSSLDNLLNLLSPQAQQELLPILKAIGYEKGRKQQSKQYARIFTTRPKPRRYSEAGSIYDSKTRKETLHSPTDVRDDARKPQEREVDSGEILFRSIDDTRTADYALDSIEQATADYADSLNAERGAIIDAITPKPDDSLRTIAEKMRFREIGRELVTRDNTDHEKFIALPNKISNAMADNDARHKHTALAESQYDSMQRLHNLIDDLRKQGALIDERFDPWLTQNQSRSRAQAETNIFDLTYRPPLYDAIARGIRALFPSINTKDKAENAKGYSHLSLYAQARTAVERQAIKSAQARAEAEEKGEEYKERDFGGLAGIQEAIFGLYNAIDNDVESAKGNIEKLTALATERGIPTVQEYIDNAEAKLGNPDNNGTAAHQLWTAIRSISAYQLTYSYNAGLTSRAGYQTLTYGRNIDGLLRERYNMQVKQIKDNPGSYDNVTDYDKDGNATATRMVLNDNARIALNKLNKEYAAAIDNVPMPGKNGSWQQLIDTGWLTEEDVNSLHRYYMYYMPLKGHAELTAEDIVDYENKTPRNISKIKAVEGHSHLAKDPFNQLILDTHGAIQNAEQNRWRLNLYNILTNNPNPSQYVVEQRFYKIETKSDGSKEYVPYGTVETINGAQVFIPGRPTAEELANGTAVSYNNRFTRAEVDIPIRNDQRMEHSVTVMVDGESYTMFFFDKRIADAINGTNIKRPSEIWKQLDKLQALNRLYAGLKTSLNPTFTLISNLPRDWMEMVSNNFIEHGFAHAVTSFIYRVRATRAGDVQAALRKHQEGTLLTMADATSDVERYVVEFFNNGGSVNITQLPDYNTAKVELMDDLNTYMRTGQMPKGSAWARGFNNMAERVELAPRLATYIASRTLGRNISQSINDAKEATVNFDRKGSWSGIMGMFQLFYNAAAQSVRRQISLARRHPVRFLATYATIGLLSPLNSIMASYISSLLLGDDDDIEDICRKYFAINPELRRRYFIILIGDSYYRIPMAVNYQPYVTLGDVIANWRLNPNYRPNVLKDTLDIVSAVLDTFLPSMIAQPIGFFFDTITAKNEQERAQAFISLFGSAFNRIPILEPLGQSIANYNFMGGTLYDRPFDKNSQEPAYLRARQYTQPVWVWASHLLNDITGGNEVHAGWLNIAPEAIENVMTVFGGYGEYGENVASLIGGGVEHIPQIINDVVGLYKSKDTSKLITGTLKILYSHTFGDDDFKKSIPMLSRLYGGNTAERYDKSMQSMFYDDTTALAQYAEYRKNATTASTRADFDREYSPDEQRYFADLATMQTIAKRIREDVKAATPEGEAPKYHADERLKAIYNLANEQFHSLASGEYKPIDDPYYTYMYIKDAIEKAPHRTTDGTYRLIDRSERSADRRGHLNQLLQSFSETRSKHKALPSGYYPGMPLDNREEQALNQFNIAVGKLIEAYKNADLDNLTPTDNAQ